MLRTVVLCVVLPALAFSGPLQWPQTYQTSGLIILPYGDIAEPFTAIVDMSTGKSYLNTYENTAIVINRADMGDFGTMFKIVPYTTKQFANKLTCFKVPGQKDGKVMAQGVLPDLSLYDYVVDGPYNNKTVSIYMSNFTEGTKINNYTLLVDKDTGFPVFFRFVGFDRLFGSHYDEYIIEYNTFTTNIDSTQFDVMNNYQCIGFPGPGLRLPAAENPFFEYVGGEGYKDHHRTAKVNAEFESFKTKHGRKYNDESEEAQRKTHFRHNHRFVNSMNRKGLSYSLKLNHLSDRSDNEIRRMRGYRHTKDTPKGEIYISKTPITDVPVNFNWWMRGAVTPVKDQGICGSCWSFGTTGTLEGSLFIKSGMLTRLSEQALIDCSWGFGNNGCDGGESERAFSWMLDSGCIPTEDSYGGGRYLMEDGYCMINASRCGAKISKFYNVPSGNVSALLTAIYEHGPIEVAIDASLRTFSFYSNGVYFDPQCRNGPDDLDHSVLAVGFGTLDNKDYYLIKNSWSTHWGNDGYILMSRDQNNCGVATDASYADIV